MTLTIKHKQNKKLLVYHYGVSHQNFCHDGILGHSITFAYQLAKQKKTQKTKPLEITGKVMTLRKNFSIFEPRP